MHKISSLCLIVFILSACAYQPADTDKTCNLDPVVVPTMPSVIPPEFELDKSTNLHLTGDPQVIDVEQYRLAITGKVDEPLLLTYDDLRCMPKISTLATLNCPYTFIDTAEWSGVRLADLLKRAGLQDGAANIVLISADGWEAKIDVKDALLPENFLAYEWKGEPLPIMHGFPLRAVFPEMDGSRWVKWLVGVRVE